MPATDTTTDKDIAPDGLPVVTLPPEVDPSTPAGLREAVAIAVETETARFKMATWRDAWNACGTTACLAGWAIHLAPGVDYVLTPEQLKNGTDITNDAGEDLCEEAVWVAEGSVNRIGTINGRPYGDIEEVAADLLDVESEIFYEDTRSVLDRGVREHIASGIRS